MNWITAQLKHGIFGTGWTNAGVSILLAIGIYLTNKIYAILNHGPNVIFLRSPIDDLIPLFPPFVIPYVSLEPFVYATLILFLLFRTRIFQSAALSMIAAWFVSYAFYIFLQSYMDRPTLTGNDPLIQMIREVYAGDNAYNCFPSLHTSLSTILGIHWLRVDKRVGTPIAIWVTLIVLSTVFVKQHYIADVIGGLALAFSVSWFFLNRFASRQALVAHTPSIVAG
ncbi:MAG: phosphatase PAP2 family protein [Chloroflexi bacterium]|nr:phosphatase PAP2 family protein [Chloroflexota bacterium]